MNKWIHIIGISGVATSAVAVMFKKMGWKVTGSDKAFFPPASSYIKDNGIEIQVGFSEAHLYDDKGQTPDLVMYQGTKGENNPEILKARELGIKMQTYPELINDYILVPESIVVTGTYGKTTITSALVEMFLHAGINVSYMYAGVPVGHKFNAQSKNNDTKYSIIEGDEFIVSTTDKRSKFELYSSKYLILNAIQWEHVDVFKTEQEYINAFAKLVQKIPEDGIIVANANDKNVLQVARTANCKVVYYSVDESKANIQPNWKLIKSSKPLPCFVRNQSENDNLEIIPYEKKIIGDFNEENLLAAATLAYTLGIKKERIQETIKEYQGIKRRLEIKYQSDSVIIIDDLGSSPPKAKGAIEAIRNDYPESKLIIIFEPNAGNRVEASLKLFDNAFDGTDLLILPRFSILPTIKDVKRFNEEDLYDYLSNKANVKLIRDDDAVIATIVEETKANKSTHTVVLFLSSHSLRGMVESLIEKLKA